jgi:GSH-dependent disulfide-bond oxidoreductase
MSIRTAAVTGGSGLIGSHVVARLTGMGCTVVNLDRAPPTDPSVRTIAADLSGSAGVEAAFAEVDAALKGMAPDLLVCCASIARATPILDQSASDIEAMIAVNVLGVALTAREAARRMARVGRGSIVVITSVAAEEGWAGEAIYGVTKAAQKGLVQGLAVDLAPFGITVNAVGPGIVTADRGGMSTTRGDPEVLRHDVERSVLQHGPEPDEGGAFPRGGGAALRGVAVDTRKGEQHSARLPRDQPQRQGARHHRRRRGRLRQQRDPALPRRQDRAVPAAGGDTARGELLSWLMFVASGVGPFSGQAVHFRNFAPAREPYALKRYDFEARRHWQVVEDRLAQGRWMLGDTYTIVDMAVWGWGSRLTYMLGDDRIMETYPNLDRLMKEIDARPAAKAAQALKERHAFKVEFDEDAMRSLYPQIFAPDPV